MISLIRKLFANDKIRYIFAGGCTTVVNFVVFFVLRNFSSLGRNTSNVIAISTAIVFAYFINKLFVFKSKTKSISEVIREAVTFVCARLISMAVEVLGLAILCDSFRMKEWVAKVFIVQILVLVLNYIFSKIFVFNKERKTMKKWLKDNFIYYMPFLIIFVIMLVVFIAEKIAPFGSNSITLIDSLHQYVPFYSDYMDKLKNEGSLFYTWNIALGSNFMSLSSYYLSSPFNYILLLFNKTNIVAGACIIIALKIALSGTTMAYFLSKRGKKPNKNITIIAISLCYALSNYVIGYNWCTMWMDVIMIFPLIMLGFERLMRDNNPKLYVITLFYALYCNYYIGFIVCVFLVLWFFVYNHGKIRDFFVHGLKFAYYSLISGGLSAFLLLPAYYGIMSTAAGDMHIPKWKWLCNIFNLLKQQLIFTKPMTNQTFDGGVNLYCGMFAILAVFLYFFTDKIKLAQKIKMYILLAILAISFDSTTLNYIWHGFHDQYGIPNRFSFLFIFVVLLMAHEALQRISKNNIFYIAASFLLSCAYVLLIRLEATEIIDNKVIIASIVVLLLYTVACGLRSQKVLDKKAFNIIFTLLCTIEICVMAVMGFFENGYTNYSEKYESTNQVAAANERVREIADESNLSFYRCELMDSTVLDEATWHNMPSLGTFCSTVLGEVTTTMGKLGFYTGANEFLYMGSTPFTNSIFGINYLLHREDDLNNYMYDYLENVENVDIFKNPYPLSLGFAVSNKTYDWDRYAGLPFTNITDLAYKMTGKSGFFNTTIPEFFVDSDDCDLSVSDNTIDFSPYSTGEMTFTASFFAEKDGDYYVNCRGNYVDDIRFYINGEEFAYDRYQVQIFHLGDLCEGDYVTIEYCYDYIDVSSEVASIYVATYDNAAYDSVYRELSANQLEVSEFDDGYVKGSIDMPEGKTLFTSIPYDEGWKVYVDGKKARYVPILDAFIGIDMTPGHHEIEMKYVPRGLYLGLIVTGISIILFIIGIFACAKQNQYDSYVSNETERAKISKSEANADEITGAKATAKANDKDNQPANVSPKRPKMIIEDAEFDGVKPIPVKEEVKAETKVETKNKPASVKEEVKAETKNKPASVKEEVSQAKDEMFGKSSYSLDDIDKILAEANAIISQDLKDFDASKYANVVNTNEEDGSKSDL